MNDPFGSMKNMMSQFQRFAQNPTQFIMNNKLNLPQNFNGDPNAVIQHLLNTGQVTQEQYNWANSMAKKIQSNPQFKQMLGSVHRP